MILFICNSRPPFGKMHRPGAFITINTVYAFGCYCSNKKNIIASLLKFAGYIHSHKVLPGNIFGLILKNKMAARDVYST